MSMMRTKSVEQSIRDTEEPEFRLNKVLGPLDLIVFGVGVTIGTGIFVLTGIAAATYAGPAIALSFVVSGAACALAALCYAEFASTVPVAGSAYTYSYATLGELVAWIIGWDLILEFTVGASVVSLGWSGYFTQLLQSSFGVSLPTAITSSSEGFVNLPAAAIVLFLTGVVLTGIRLSSRLNMVITAIKLAVVLFFIVIGAFFVDASNWAPFVPPAVPAGGDGSALQTPVLQLLLGIEQQAFGLGGIVFAAALVFFAYIGFDIVATTSEEARNPQRDMPIGILGSLAVCTVLYILVCVVMTGILPYGELNDPAPMAKVFSAIGQDWAAGLVSLGAIAGLTTVIMVLILGQSRVAFAMSRDNLLPVWFSKVHPRFRTPYRITLLTGLVVAVLAAITPIETVVGLFNIGTLFAFVLVPIGVLVLRRTRPDLPRAFRTPFVPVLPVLAALACLFLMLNLEVVTWLRFLAWMGLGVLVYVLYGARRSRLARGESLEETDDDGSEQDPGGKIG
jgi:APA family basic amino acid/polyamine antiporter